MPAASQRIPGSHDNLNRLTVINRLKYNSQTGWNSVGLVGKILDLDGAR
jgi:hypothetical protein